MTDSSALTFEDLVATYENTATHNTNGHNRIFERLS